MFRLGWAGTANGMGWVGLGRVGPGWSWLGRAVMGWAQVNTKTPKKSIIQV